MLKVGGQATANGVNQIFHQKKEGGFIIKRKSIKKLPKACYCCLNALTYCI